MDLFHRCRIVVALCLLPVSDVAGPFTRGDVDQGGRIDVADAIRILDKLFAGGRSITCDDAADVDDDGSLTVSDPIFLLGALFRGGPPPSAPFPGCGEDPTADGLSCAAYVACNYTFTFFGQELSADAVFFVIDKSAAILESGELARIRMEVRRVLEDMPDDIRFSVIFFDANMTRFPEDPEPAVSTAETRTSAMAFVTQTPGGAGTCGAVALHAAIESARLSEARRSLILYVSDGGGTCGGMDEAHYLRTTLEEVTLANSGIARIYTFELELYMSPVMQAFLEGLAARNGGVLVRP